MSSKIHAFNSSRIGHCYALCVGVSQNATALLSTNTPRPEHITPVLHTLHWRQVRLTTDFKVLMSVFKALSGLASLYLLGILPLYKKKNRALRLSNRLLLKICRWKPKRWRDQTFSVTRTSFPLIYTYWPGPVQIQLKTYLFRGPCDTLQCCDIHSLKSIFSSNS